jgi:YggT family protein
MDILIIPIISVLLIILQLYSYAVFIYVILGWLEHFKIVNSYNNVVFAIHTFFFRIVEPATSRIRGIVPSFGGIDLSPIILLIGIYGVQVMLTRLAMHFPH